MQATGHVLKTYEKSLSHVRLFAILWTVAHQSPLPVGFHRHEYWSGLPVPAPRDLPNPGIELMSPALLAESLPFEPSTKPVTEVVMPDSLDTARFLWELTV